MHLPLDSMAQAAPWLLQIKECKEESNFLSETKYREVSQKMKTPGSLPYHIIVLRNSGRHEKLSLDGPFPR